MPPKSWHSPSGTLMSECPKCHDLGLVVDDCEICAGTNEVGMGAAVQYILNHGDTDPPAAPGDDEKDTGN